MKSFKYKIIALLWRICDYILPKKDNMWAFATHHLCSTKFIENQRAVFEFVKADSSICKIIFYRNNKNDIYLEDAVNVELVRQGTFRAYYLLMLCKVVFITHSIAMDFSIRFGERNFQVLKMKLRGRIIVNLWHGIAIKKLLAAANEGARKRTDRAAFRKLERKFYSGLIASSKVDGLIMAAMFYPLNYGQIWATGLPRNDFLLQPIDELPSYIRDSIVKLENKKADKKLVVYAPTYRQTSVSKNAYYYQFKDGEIVYLIKLLKKHNAILGYRPHYFKNDNNYFNLDKYVDNELIFDFSQDVIPEFSALARACDVLITDYSSVALETIYLNKLSMSFAYDIENYKNEQDGLIYDLPMVFGRQVYTSFENLMIALDDALSKTESGQKLDNNRDLFFSNRDCHNSERVVNKVKQRLKMKNL